MKKKVMLITIIIIVLILLIPIPGHLKDGGTVEYTAITYKISKVHRIANYNCFDEGIIIDVLGIEIYNNVKQCSPQIFTNEELSNMALDYFLKNSKNTLPKEKYTVGISEEIIPKYQNQDMVVVEIRHINNANNTLDARYYINIYTAQGFDDSENKIEF